MDLVKVVNRSDKPVIGMFDGVRYVWEPGEEKVLPANVAELCKRQNPVMGTEDYQDINSADYLLALPSDPQEPVVQSDAKERFDRDTIPIDPAHQQTMTIDLHRKAARSRGAVAVESKNITGIQADYDD